MDVHITSRKNGRPNLSAPLFDENDNFVAFGALRMADLLVGLDHSAVGVALLDKSFRFRAVNRALAIMNGYPVKAHKGKALHQVLGNVATDVGSAMECVFHTGRPLAGVKVSGQLPKRSDVGQWIEYYFPVVSRQREIKGVGAFVLELKSNSLSPHTSSCITSDAASSHTSESAYPQKSKGYAGSKGHILSERQRQVLGFLAAGKSNKEIADILQISVKTVECYRTRITVKIGAPSFAYLVHYAISHGIADLLT